MPFDFDEVALIVNMNGKNADPKLVARLESTLAKVVHDLLTFRTQDIDHARNVVAEVVADNRRPLILWYSGDGGGNVIVTAAYEAKLVTGNCVTVAPIGPGGDANDHFRSVFDLSTRQMINLVLAGKTRPLDLIEIRFDGRVIYAHSYAAAAGFQAEFNAVLNALNEKAREEGGPRLGLAGQVREMIRQRSLAEPFTVIWPDGTEEKILNLSIHNIEGMAKLANPAPGADPSDGRLELLVVRPKGKHHFSRLAVHGVKSHFKLVKADPMPDPLRITLPDGGHLQIDGEDDWFPPGEIEFRCIAGGLQTLAK